MERRAKTTKWIAETYGYPQRSIDHIAATRPHIKPIGRAGMVRIYDDPAIALILAELKAQDARRRSGRRRQSVAPAPIRLFPKRGKSETANG